MNCKTIYNPDPNGIISSLTLNENGSYPHAPYAYKKNEGKPVANIFFYSASFEMKRGASFSFNGKYYNHVIGIDIILRRAEEEELAPATIAIEYGEREIDNIRKAHLDLSELPDDLIDECKTLIGKGQRDDKGGYLYDALFAAFEVE